MYQHESTRHTCVPHPEPSSLLPPHTIPHVYLWQIHFDIWQNQYNIVKLKKKKKEKQTVGIIGLERFKIQENDFLNENISVN